MVVGIFRSRLREIGSEGYGSTAERMEALVREIPGFRSLKTFIAEDGERVSLFEFESLEALDAWKRHPEHLEAQRRGREEFYAAYELLICNPIRHMTFEREP